APPARWGGSSSWVPLLTSTSASGRRGAVDRLAQIPQDRPAVFVSTNGREGAPVDTDAMRRPRGRDGGGVRPRHAAVGGPRGDQPVVTAPKTRPTKVDAESGVELDRTARPEHAPPRPTARPAPKPRAR